MEHGDVVVVHIVQVSAHVPCEAADEAQRQFANGKALAVARGLWGGPLQLVSPASLPQSYFGLPPGSVSPAAG